MRLGHVRHKLSGHVTARLEVTPQQAARSRHSKLLGHVASRTVPAACGPRALRSHLPVTPAHRCLSR
eukprot:693412-Rhodomonas_salina.1